MSRGCSSALTAPAVWNIVTTQIVAAEHASLSEQAHAFALVNMALGDAGVAVFDTKYHYAFWRPETAIHFADIDGNPRTDADPSFVPFITTPCFPSYPSAHGTLSNAAREVLERLYGRPPSVDHDFERRRSALRSPTRHCARSPTTSRTRASTAAFTSGSIRRRAQSRAATSAGTSTGITSNAVTTRKTDAAEAGTRQRH